VTPVTAALMHKTAKYFITFTPKCFPMAVAAVSAKLQAILRNIICKTLQFLCLFVNSANAGQFCTYWPILCKILRAQNHRILTSLIRWVKCEDSNTKASLLNDTNDTQQINMDDNLPLHVENASFTLSKLCVLSEACTASCKLHT